MSKNIHLISITSSDDGCDWVLIEFVACGNAKCSDFNDASRGRLQIARFIVWIYFVSSFMNVRWPMRQGEIAYTARSTGLRALVAVLD